MMETDLSTLDERREEDLHREMIRLFCELGPFRHTEVARQLSVSKDSVFRYYHRLLRGRVRFIPIVNGWALGLRRVIVRVAFFHEFEPYGKEICVGLAQLAYLAYFSRLMPENEWMLQFQVPFRHQGKVWEFLTKLEGLRVLKVKEVYQTDMRVGAPFRSEYFDSRAMRFRFDWSSVRPPSYVVDTSRLYNEKVSFDTTDLRIIEQMQIEPLKIAEAGRKAELGKWTTYWHWRKHVKDRMIRGWYVDWLGTWIIDQSPRAMSRRDSTVVSLFAKSLSPGELKELRQKLNSLPYLWSEHIGKSDMVSQIIVPNEELVGFFSYVGSLDDSMKSKIILRIEDQSRAIRFTVPRNLYDDREGWTFDYEDVLGRFRNMAVQVRLRAAGTN